MNEPEIRKRLWDALQGVVLHDGVIAVEDCLKEIAIEAAIAKLAELTEGYAARAEHYHAFRLAADLHRHSGERLTYNAALHIFRRGAGMIPLKPGGKTHEDPKSMVTLVGMLDALCDRGLPVHSADKPSLCDALAEATGAKSSGDRAGLAHSEEAKSNGISGRICRLSRRVGARTMSSPNRGRRDDAPRYCLAQRARGVRALLDFETYVVPDAEGWPFPGAGLSRRHEVPAVALRRRSRVDRTRVRGDPPAA